MKRDTWSTSGLGFGLDKDLRQLFRDLRPLEFADSQWAVQHSNVIVSKNITDEWDNVRALFRYKVGNDEDLERWGCDRRLHRNQSDDDMQDNDPISEVRILADCNDPNLNLDACSEKEFTRNASYDDYNDNGMFFDDDDDIDFVDSNKRLHGETVVTAGGEYREESSHKKLNRAIFDDKLAFHSEDSSIKVEKAASSALSKFAKMLEAPHASKAIVINRPLLPVSRVQQLLIEQMNLPPLSTLIR